MTLALPTKIAGTDVNGHHVSTIYLPHTKDYETMTFDSNDKSINTSFSATEGDAKETHMRHVVRVAAASNVEWNASR